MRDTDARQSVFDDEAFKFYIIKYAEILGLDALLIATSKERKMSYDQKRKILEYVLKTEVELKITESSWKHCLLFLYHNGSLTKEQLMAEFTSPEVLELARVVKAKAEHETYDSVKVNR